MNESQIFIDPSIPMNDGSSPFSNASHHVVDHIFRRFGLTVRKPNVHSSFNSYNTREKMRLQLVCQKFRSRILEAGCWEFNDEVAFSVDGSMETSDKKWILNSKAFSEDGVADALKALLKRTTVKEFYLDILPNRRLFTLVALSRVIIKFSQAFQLRFVQFKMDGTEADGFLVSALTACDLTAIQEISIMNCRGGSNGNRNFIKTSFWPFVTDCPNLRSLIVLEAPQFDFENQITKMEKHCKKLESIEVSFKFESLLEGSVHRFANFCNSIGSLKRLHVHSQANQVKLLVINLLMEECRSRIQTFTCDAAVDIDFMKNLTNLFPNLKELYFTSRVVYTHKLALEIVQKFCMDFRHRRGGYKFKLKLEIADNQIFPTYLRNNIGSDYGEVIANISYKIVSNFGLEIFLEIR